MEPYTPGAEIFKDGVLYTARFPIPTAEKVEAELAEYAKDSPEVQAFLNRPPEDVTKILQEAKERFTYKLRPEAAEGAEKFIALAVTLSKRFEMDMEIRRLERCINVKTDIYLDLSFTGAVKQYIDALLHMASEFSIQPKDDENVILSLDYNLYDRIDSRTGEKADW